MRHRPVGALLGCAIACASAAAQPGKISVPIAVEAVAVSEAPEGASDSNWVVGNIVDGTWASPPYYPDLQWMARHIGQPGFDIWCRLELGEERTVHEVDLQNTGFGAFVHLKDIRLVFSDGTTRDIVMAQDDERQTFAFDPTPTEWVEIHLLSHYGDGAGINENSGGFAEVALFETRAAPGLGRHDLDGDGRSYLLVCLWQDHVAAFIADDGSLPWTDDWDRDWDAYLDQAHNVGENPPVTWNPMRGAWGSYTLLVDREDDGDFDGDEDYWYQVIDLDGDGDPDIERTDRYVGWGELVKYNFDLDDDNRSNNLAWSVPGYGDEQACTTEGNYVSDRAGNGFFLQGWLNMRGEIYSDTRAAWENPIAWYDLDDDGSTEMVVRVTDTHGRCEGTLMEVEVAFDLDNASDIQRQSSLDLQVSWLGHESRPYDYSHMVEDFPALGSLPAADYLFGRRLPLRRQTQRMYFPYFDAYKIGTELHGLGWDSVFLLVDEDNDDVRWEEMFSPHEGYGYEDHLGDRWESDDDYDGGGRLYVGKFDGRIHLYEAERAEWTIDCRAMYKGSIDRPREGPEPPEGLRYSVVRYADTDDNGFIDQITHGDVVYGDEESFEPTRVVNLLDFATAEDPHPDACELFDIRTADALSGRKVSDWDGTEVTGLRLEAYDRLRRLFEQTAEQRWQDALALYAEAKEAGLLSDEDAEPLPAAALEVDPRDHAALGALVDVRPGRGYADLTETASRWATYQNAYWLAERVFADLLDATPERRRKSLARLYYTGGPRALADEIAQSKKEG